MCRVETVTVHQTTGAIDTRERGHPALELRGDGLSPEEQQKLLAFLEKWQHVFAAHDEDFGCTSTVSPTGAAHPIRERYRPVPPKLHTELTQ